MMRRRLPKLILGCVCSLGGPAAAGAQTLGPPAPPGPAAAASASGAPPAARTGAAAISLPDALAYAAAHQPSLQAAQARIEVARRGASVVRAEWLPQLGGTAQLFGGTMNNTTAMFLGVRTMDLPRIGASRTSSDAAWSDAYPSTLVGIGLRQTVFDFGRIAAQAAVADHEVRFASHRADLERLELGLQIESAYYAVLAAKAVERAATDAYTRAALRLDMVKAGVERGLRPPIDLTRAEADRTRFDVGRTRARGNIELAQAQLAAAIGWGEPLLDAMDVTLDADTPLPPLGEALRSAVEQDPAVRAGLARLLQQQAITRATAMQLVPSLQLTASLSGRAGGTPTSSGPSGSSGWVPEVANWDVGVVLSVPMFDGVLLARRAQSQAQEAVLQHEVDALRRGVLAGVQRAYTSFQVARDALRALIMAAGAARRNYDQASARFRAGLATSVELADAEALRTEAEIQLAVGRFEIARSRALFNRALAAGL
ncbi:MAG: TolC family protein [Polyangia bacterium]